MLSFKDNGNDETERLLEIAGHDTPLHWRDNQSGILVITSAWDIQNALDELNATLVSDEITVIETFYSALKKQYIEVPQNSFAKNGFDYGWTYNCFNDNKGPYLYLILDHSFEDGITIFNFSFNKPYCENYVVGCDNCDKCLFGMID